jgi:hypothetical protein
VKLRVGGDGRDPERTGQDVPLRLLPAVYVEMPPEKEEQAVAAVAGLIGVVADRGGEMALTSARTWRSGLDQPSRRPGQRGDDGIE